jgi:hypothetical protein
MTVCGVAEVIECRTQASAKTGEASDSGKALLRALPCLASLFFAVSRRGVRLKRVNKPFRGSAYFIDRLVEGGFVRS